MSKGRDVDTKYYSNGLVAPINLSTEQFYEQVKSSQVQVNVGDILYKGINIYNNALYLLVHTETKGAIDHIRTMRCIVGQQTPLKNGVF